MDGSLLSPMMLRRKSVRSFTDELVSPDVLSAVHSFATRATPLFPDIKVAYRILSRADISCVCALSAPHYLAIYSTRDPDSDLNSGFLLEQTDLFLSSLGLGACWLGMARPIESEFEGLPCVILLSFGKPVETAYRASTQEFRRKNLSDVATSGAIPRYIESMRLAPSAMNKQPWFFSGDEKTCHAFSVRGKGLINIAEGWRFVDLGIALCHLFVAASADGRSVSFRREDAIPSIRGNEYVISCRISS